MSALEENYGFASWLTSKTDAQEAISCGEAAVKAAVGGKTGSAVSMSRVDGETYGVTTSTISLEEATGQERAFPADWVHDNSITLKHQFYKYASPFIQDELELSFDGGLPFFVRLSKRKIERKLEAYASAT